MFVQSTCAEVDTSAAQASYQQSCARCHGAALTDGVFGPALRGNNFLKHWAGRSAAELFAYLKQTMPPGAAGTLDDNAYVQITAYLLERNDVAINVLASAPSPAALEALRFPKRAPSELEAANDMNPLAAGAVLPAWPREPNPLEHFTTVTDTMLQNPSAEDWLTWRRGYAADGFSPLAQINKQNVKDLRLAWSLALPAGANEATPLMHDGVLFVHSPDDSVFALNAATGSLLWRYKYTNRTAPSMFPAQVRNMAVYGTKLYLSTPDTRVIALDARNGTLVWEHAVADPTLWATTGGPLVAQGIVMQGVAGRAPGGAFIVGLDAENGAERWRFHSIAQHGDANENSWNETPPEKRSGGSVWIAGSYDVDLNTAYFGTAQTYDTALLLHPVKKHGITNAGLYLDSTIALDPQTGKLKWYYQHLPNDQWDFDFAFERQIIALPIDGKLRKIVVTAGKPGIYEALTADNGKYLFSIDLGLQNVIVDIDPHTGVKQIDPRRYPSGGVISTICPHSGGARNWPPGAYDPPNQTVYIPLVESCMDLVPVGPGESGPLSTGYTFTLRPRPDSDGRYGRLEAINLATRKSVWKARRRAPQTSGVLATAGGLVFAGALDRSFSAHDAATGEVLWEAVLSDVPSAAPISYMVGGNQYVAMIVGYGGPHAATFKALTPEITLPLGSSSAIWVFELPHHDNTR
jgi:alcohol dehydrogenase (cytochrome c)